MDKVIQVINTLVEKKEKISNVVKEGATYYFLYRGKNKFSITPKKDMHFDAFWLTVYPAANYTLDDIISNPRQVIPYDIPSIVYDSDDYKDQESIESFRELMKTLLSKLYDVDAVFRDILNEDDDI